MMFVITIPITIGFLFTAKRVGKFGWHQLLGPVVVMTFTATFLDGVALTWFHTLYANSYEIAMFGGALILWGVGMGLCMAYVLEQRWADRKKNTAAITEAGSAKTSLPIN
ncbi:hypothetical protein GCM10027423_59770 [Spirosoma arcticum]